MSLKAFIPPSRQKEKPTGHYKWIGKSIKRLEDPKLLLGRGTYIDDVRLPGMLHAAMLRSPHAHARIRTIDKSKAEALLGVIAVMTGAEAAAYSGPLPSFSSPPVVQYAIARERVRHVGEPVVAVVAESRYVAEDAIELIEVEYEPLPVVATPQQALRSKGAEVLHPDLGDTNVYLERKIAFGPVDKDFESADVVIKRKLRWPRSGAQPIETCGAVADYDRAKGAYTICANTSMYNYIGHTIADTLKVPSHKLNFVPVLVGGSFGSKMFIHKVPVIAAILSRATGCPVKLMEDRLDNATSCDNHGSDRYYEAELALKKDGTMLSFKSKVLDDYGAYLQFGIGTHGNALAQIIGPYRINSVLVDITAVFTNKCQQGAYRGFGSEVANFVIERMVDAAALELGIDRFELRRKNFIGPNEFPYLIPTGNMYDSGNYEEVLDHALRMADLNTWRREKERLRKEGRYIGIGVATCQERSVFSATEFWMWNVEHGPGEWTSAPEGVSIKIDPTGKALVTLHAPFWGNSPETVTAQILAEQLTINPDDIEITYSNSKQGVVSAGPAGSRYTVMIAGAIVGAAGRIREKVLRVAGHLMEASPQDLEFVDGRVRVKGSDMSLSLAEISDKAHFYRLSLPDDPELTSGLDATYVYDQPITTLPPEDRSHMGIFYPIMGHSCHIPVVEVDIETGQVSFLKYIAVHDCGTVVNPMTLRGHVRGGTVNGIGTALLEQYKYDDSGQLQTALFTDYLLPGIHDVPSDIECGHVETPSPYTEYGIKGGGEGGRMGAPPAIASAIEDALQPFGIRIDGLPLTPAAIRRLIREAKPTK